jgi:hypothetical protein
MPAPVISSIMGDFKNPIEQPIEDHHRPWFKKRLVLATVAGSVILIILASVGLYFFYTKSNLVGQHATSTPQAPQILTSPLISDDDECDDNEMIKYLLSKIYSSAKQPSSMALKTALELLVSNPQEETGTSVAADLYQGMVVKDITDLLASRGVSVQGKANTEMAAKSEFQVVLSSMNEDGTATEIELVENGKPIAMHIFDGSSINLFVSKVQNGWETHTRKFISDEDIKQYVIDMIVYQYTPLDA